MITWLCVVLAVTSTAGPIAGLIALWITALVLAVWFRRFRGTVLTIGLLTWLLWPHRIGYPPPSPSNGCISQMRQLQLAILNYESDHGHFPPPFTVDDKGNRLHSWRVLILPYMEQEELYRQIDLTKPWNDPVNLKFADQMPQVLQCPSYEPASLTQRNTTSYVAVVGPQTAWPPTGLRKASDFKDGTGHTISLVESEFNRINWMAPFDPTFDSIVTADGKHQLLLAKCPHKGEAIGAFVDVHTKRIPGDLDLASLRAMLTIAGGEEVPRQFQSSGTMR
ncbi:MAG: DUF1559 domain-containing protein [Pirellulales bacterium]